MIKIFNLSSLLFKFQFTLRKKTVIRRIMGVCAWKCDDGEVNVYLVKRN